MIIVCQDDNYKVFDTLNFHKTYFIPPSNGNFNTGKSWYYVSTDKFPTSDNFEFFTLKVWIYDTGDSISSWVMRKPRYRIYIWMPDKRSKSISVYNEKVTPIAYNGDLPLGVKIRFNYFEVSKGIKTLKSTETFWYNTTGYIYLTPAKLYTFIKNGVPKNPDVEYRVFKNLDILYYSGPKDLIMYLALFNSDKEFFSGVSFFETPFNRIVDGYGIFREYTKDSINGLKFDQKTLDSLAAGQFTKELKFVPYQ